MSCSNTNTTHVCYNETLDDTFKTEHQNQVELFMNKAGQHVPSYPTVPDLETRKVRARLVLEEALELINALGLEVRILECGNLNACDVTDTSRINIDQDFTQLDPPILSDIAKECADVIVVTTGTASSCGIGLKKIQKEVDANNLEKFGPGSYRDNNGKWRKPTNYKKPDLTNHIEEQ